MVVLLFCCHAIFVQYCAELKALPSALVFFIFAFCFVEIMINLFRVIVVMGADLSVPANFA